MITGLPDALFGSEKPGKKSRRQTLRENQERGRMGRRRTEFWMGSAGRDMRRAPRGQDHTAAKHNSLTGRGEKRHIEVKMWNAKPSPLQKKMQKKHGDNYHVMSGDGVLDKPNGRDPWGPGVSHTKTTRRRRSAKGKMPSRKSAFGF